MAEAEGEMMGSNTKWTNAVVILGGLLAAACARAGEPSPEVALLSSLVSISSGTADVAGVNQVQEKIEARLKQLGFTTGYLEKSGQGGGPSGRMLVATLSGADPRFITLVGHADTVFEKLNPFALSADGKTARGSGVTDNKGGVVVGLTALERYLKGRKPHYSLRFVSSPSEETGSPGFLEQLKALSADSILLVGLEPALSDGSFITSRKGIRWYKIQVHGRESHAGVDHPKGINACEELAVKILEIQKLTNYALGTTVSIAHIEGGKDKFNIVCGEAMAKIDTRFASSEQARLLFARIEAILAEQHVRSFATKEPTHTEFEIPEDVPPLPNSSRSEALQNRYAQIVGAIEGRTVRGASTGGAADLNRMVRDGVYLIDGVGPVGSGMHTADESVDIGSLTTRARALAELLEYADGSLKAGK